MKNFYRRDGNYTDSVFQAKIVNHDYVCLNCEKSLAFDRRRVRFCSTKCEKEYYKKHPLILWSNLRLQCFERDNYKCKKCGCEVSQYTAECDHVVPIWKGGADLDLNNLQTLCEKHHEEKTRAEARERTKIGLLIAKGIQKSLGVF